MTKRKPIGKKLRFEVFKRDNFTCQYCGAQAPDVVLHVDHINPVAGGGDNDILNLVTSCEPCNLGKGARELDDNSVLAKQRAQLKELSQRREQLEMMVNWREGLKSLDDDLVAKVEDLFLTITSRTLTDVGRKKVRQWLRRYSFTEVCDAMEGASESYWHDAEEEEDRCEQAEKVFSYTPIICAARKRNAGKPWMKDLYWCRGVIRSRHYCNDQKAIQLLERAYDAGIEIDVLKGLCLSSRSWTEWHRTLEDLLDGEDA